MRQHVLAGVDAPVDLRAEVGAHLTVRVDGKDRFDRHRVGGHRGAHVDEEAATDAPAQVVHRRDLAGPLEGVEERGEALLAVEKQKPRLPIPRRQTVERARAETHGRVSGVQGKERTDGVTAKH